MCSPEMQWALTAMAQKAKTPLKMLHKSCHSACSASPSGVPEVRVTAPSFTPSSRILMQDAQTLFRFAGLGYLSAIA